MWKSFLLQLKVIIIAKFLSQTNWPANTYMQRNVWILGTLQMPWFIPPYSISSQFQLKTSKFRELWSPTQQIIWPWSRAKVMVMTWCQLKGLVTRTMHAKHQCSIIHTSEDPLWARLKFLRQTDRRMSNNVPCFPAFAKARGGGGKQ